MPIPALYRWKAIFFAALAGEASWHSRNPLLTSHDYVWFGYSCNSRFQSRDEGTQVSTDVVAHNCLHCLHFYELFFHFKSIKNTIVGNEENWYECRFKSAEIWIKGSSFLLNLGISCSSCYHVCGRVSRGCKVIYSTSSESWKLVIRL